ncbi:MAG: hypothetical protein J2P57_20190 [Acidimicrobiaceae bacterium]|nr:hypothetical protein [Acidimicrobiaceae bacterium]
MRRVRSAADDADQPGLVVLGLRPGDVVRWRPQPGGHWRTGSVSRRERDGSVGVTDRNGAARSLRVDQLEVRCTAKRGGTSWEPLTVWAGRAEQLRLL